MVIGYLSEERGFSEKTRIRWKSFDGRPIPLVVFMQYRSVMDVVKLSYGIVGLAVPEATMHIDHIA